MWLWICHLSKMGYYWRPWICSSCSSTMGQWCVARLADYPMDKIKITASGRWVQEYHLWIRTTHTNTALLGHIHPTSYLLYFGSPSDFRYWREDPQSHNHAVSWFLNNNLRIRVLCPDLSCTVYCLLYTPSKDCISIISHASVIRHVMV